MMDTFWKHFSRDGKRRKLEPEVEDEQRAAKAAELEQEHRSEQLEASKPLELPAEEPPRAPPATQRHEKKRGR